jgi:RNA polymerase sigma-70 factor (ECF subfamily)
VAEKREPCTESDEELVRGTVNGDLGAFVRLVDRHKKGIHYLAARMVGGEEAEDLGQEVFVRVYRALPSFRGASSFRTWLFRIARNHFLSELRRSDRRMERVSIDEEGEEGFHRLLPESPENLEEAIERADLSRRVRALVDRLPGPYRSALTLFYLSELKYEEVAEVMEIPLGTVKTLIHRGRLRLRELVLREMNPEGRTGASGGEVGR